MDDNSFEISRRDFLKKSAILGFSFSPLISFLAGCTKSDEQELKKCFDDEFHYFDNNLTNLHFYFINASIGKGHLRLTKGVKEAFMIVKIPQQHISEQLIRKEEFEKFKNTNTSSRISGFSFLAFKLFPTKDANDDREIDFRSADNFLNWSNENYFELIIPTKDHYKKFNGSLPNQDGLTNFRAGKTHQVALNKDACEFYKNACKTLFEGEFYPFTLLEIPQGLLVTPYTGKPESKKEPDGKTVAIKTKAVFSKPPIQKQQFIYDTKEGRITRSVQEIWNTQMWFQQFEVPEQTGVEPFRKPVGEKYNPSLRPIGYVEEEKDECFDKAGKKIDCPKRDEECPEFINTFLPTLLDKQELTYIASLGRRDAGNEDSSWNIETKGLTFTGLGAIAKFHYKNFSPPAGTDLAEYEHHITLGRDEYIKVARIGVISVTGQRALHVKIGQRKIKNGVSYMEFYEYIEIIQRELEYFDNKLFIEKPPVREPANFIHARKQRDNLDLVIHSIDKPEIPDDDVWVDKMLEPFLPDLWQTHYRRWMFKKVASITIVSRRINSDLPEAKKEVFAGAGCDCAETFWLVLEDPENGKYKDCYLDFRGFDWNDNEIKFSSTCMFIRKKAIECNIKETSKRIFKNFNDQPAERRHIQFINSEIAFTADYPPEQPPAANAAPQGELPNKSNRAKTDFVEYYFSLCSEANGIMINDDSIFNLRFFPLFPQVKRAKLYIDNIQSYTPGPLASVIEYNGDFITYGYEGVKDQAGNVYNKARLVFDHTKKFLSGEEKVLELDAKGEWVEKEFKEGYANIKRVFSGAADRIGGLVNPDFDIQSIGLVKQSIALGREINKKYEKFAEFSDGIKQFNPSDLLRQAPEIFNGISLLDILLAVFPDFEAPINEIKNVAGQIERLRDDIINNPVYVEIQDDLRKANEAIKDFIKAIEDFQKQIDEAQARIKSLKDKLNSDYFFAELENFVESAVTKYKIEFLELRDTIIPELQGRIISFTQQNIDNVVDYMVTEALSKVETLYPYWEELRKARDILNALKAYELPDKTKLSAAAAAIIQKYIDDYLGDLKYVVIDLKIDVKENALRKFDAIKNSIKTEADPYYLSYKTFTEELVKEAEARGKYIAKEISIADYSKAKEELSKAEETVNQIKTQIKDNREAIRGFLERIDEFKKKAVETDRQILNVYKNELATVVGIVQKADEILSATKLPHFINLFEKASKDFEIIKTRLRSDVLNSVNRDSLSDIINTYQDAQFAAEIRQKRNELLTFYRDKYDANKANFDQLVREGKETLKTYTATLEKPLRMLDALLPEEIKNLRKQISDEFNNLKDIEGKLRAKVKEYEGKLKEQISLEADGIVKKIKDAIKSYEDELLKDPDNRELVNKVIEARKLYNVLTTLSRKEVNYNWQTSSFKNADFGIVSFVSSSDPRTTLTVNVKNTIHFQPSQFPAVVSSIESVAENRLTNFGISLLKAVTVNFNEVSFIAGTNQAPKFGVRVRDVQFAGALSFVKALEDCFKSLLGDNFNLRLLPTSLEINYTLPIPFIGAPSFGFRDILFRIIYRLHFTKEPMELEVGIGSADNRTKLSVGIYTGLFYFLIGGNPRDGITTIEISLEFGGYFGLSLGPLRGEVKLVVGLYYRKDPTGVTIEGYFLCEGRVKLWFVMISARFYMGVRSQAGYVEGRCTVSYEVSLGAFFKLSFSATFYKKFAGSTPGNIQSGSGLRSQRILALAGVDVEAADKKAIAQEEKVKRTVRPLSIEEWNDFINSYIN